MKRNRSDEEVVEGEEPSKRAPRESRKLAEAMIKAVADSQGPDGKVALPYDRMFWLRWEIYSDSL